MSADITFKTLLAIDLPGVLPSLVPDIAQVLGLPDGAQVIGAEVLPLATDQHSRLMDAAIRYTWSTGQRAVILQIEHWSRSRDLDLSRALRYTADLVLRHRGEVVLPVMVLCDQPTQPPQDRLVVGVAEFQTLDFRVVLVQAQRDILPRWHRHPTVFLAVMAALVRDLSPTDRALRAIRFALTFGIETAARALPLIEDFATIASNETERLRFHDHLRKDRTMASVIDMFRKEFKAEGKAEGKVEGKAEGNAEGRVQALVELVLAGDLPRATAELRLRHLVEQGQATADLVEAALRRLG